jgi:hypothetical protein
MANRELDIPWEQVKLAAVAGVPFVALARQYQLKDKQGKPSTGAIRVRAMREKWPVPSRLLHKAKQAARKANEELEAARKAQPTPYPSQANSPNVLSDTLYRDTERGDMEPGLSDLGFYGENATNQGRKGTKGHDSGANLDSGKRDSGVMPLSQGFKGAGNGNMEAGLRVNLDGENASSSLQSSESMAATLIASHMQEIASKSMLQALQRAAHSIDQAPASLPIATLQDLRTALSITMQASGMDKTTNNTQLNILVSPTPKAGTWNFHDSPESPVIDT